MSIITPLMPKPMVGPNPILPATATVGQETATPAVTTMPTPTGPSTDGSTSLSTQVNATRDMAKLAPPSNDPARASRTESPPSIDVAQSDAAAGLGAYGGPDFKADEAASRQAIEAYRQEALATAVLERVSSITAGPAEADSSVTSGLARGDSNPLDPFAEIAMQRGAVDQPRVYRTA